MTKKVHWQTMMKKALAVGIPVGIAGFALLFWYLSSIGAITIIGYSGDSICEGTINDTCYAYINFTANEDIFLYPMDYDPWGRSTPFEVDSELREWKMYRSWGDGWREIKLNETCTGTWCGAPNSNGVAYSFVFRKGKDYQIKIEALKLKNEDIKWSFGPIDPEWKSVSNNGKYNKTINKVDVYDKVNSKKVADVSLTTEGLDENNHKTVYNKFEHVMEFTINSSERDEVLNHLEFYDTSGNKLNRDYKLNIFLEDGFHNETIHDFKTLQNGTKIYTGSHVENISGHWEDFSVNTELPKGEYKIRVYDYSLVSGEKIDLIPTMFKYRMSEWATYSLDENWVCDGIGCSFQKFDDDRRNSQVFTVDTAILVVKVGLNLSMVGDAGTIFGGIYNTSDGTSGTGPDTSQLVAKFTNVTASGTIGASWAFYNFTFATTNASLCANCSYGIVVDTTTQDGANYIKWVKDGSGTYTYGSSWYDTAPHDSWNAEATTDNDFQIWKTTITSPPGITLTYPEDNRVINDTTINLNGTISDSGGGVTNVSLYVNSTLISTNSSGFAATYSFPYSFSESDGQTWTYKACDVTSPPNCGFATNRTIDVDRTPPTIDYNPTSTAAGTTNITSIIVNVTASDNHLNHTRFSWNGTNESFASTAGDDWWETKSSLNDNTYTYYGWANDSLGQDTVLASRSITIDATAPVVTWVSPTNGTITTNGTIDLEVSVTESNPLNITFNLYNASGTVNSTTYLMATQSDNTSITFDNLADGEKYQVNVTVVDDFDQKTTTTERIFFTTTLTLKINLGDQNISSELGTEVNIVANSTYNLSRICVDIVHYGFGKNYSCGYPPLDFNITINDFKKVNFSNTSAFQTYNQTDINRSIWNNFTITSHQYDEVDEIKINITATSGEPSNIAFHTVNSSNSTALGAQSINASHLDRLLFGEFVGSSLYIDKFNDSTTEQNLTYQSGGEHIINLLLDDTILSHNYTLLFNLTGSQFGFDFKDGNITTGYWGFDNYSNIDTTKTDAQLDLSGMILPKNVSKGNYYYDNFQDGTLNQTKWTNSTCVSQSQCVTEKAGMMNIHEQIGGDSYGTRASAVTSNLLYVWMTDNINFTIGGSYYGVQENAYVWGNTTIWFGDSLVWNLTTCNGADPEGEPTENERTSYKINISLFKINKSTWQVKRYGYEIANITGGSGTCPNGETSYNQYYTGNPFYIDITKQYGNLFYVYSSSRTTATGDNAITIFNITEINQTLYTRENSTVTSDSIYNSVGDITAATMWTYFSLGTNESASYYMSADDGTNWEAISNGVTHSFTNQGKHLRYRIDFNITGEDNINDTTFIANVNVSIPAGNITNLSIDFGNNGTNDIVIYGQLNSTNSPYEINLSGINISDFLNESNRYSSYNHLYQIPIRFFSETPGQLDINHLNISYNPNPIPINTTKIQVYLGNLTNTSNFSIPFTYLNDTTLNASITIDALNLTYAGGNKTINAILHEGFYAENETKGITYHYSRWDYDFVPSFIDYLEFIPRTSQSKNVTPYGQSFNKSILNITNYGYSNKNASLSVYLNDTLECVNLTMSTTENKTDGYIINSSWRTLNTSYYLGTTNVWMWADYNCSYSQWYTFNPYIYFRQCCYNCTCNENL